MNYLHSRETFACGDDDTKIDIILLYVSPQAWFFGGCDIGCT